MGNLRKREDRRVRLLSNLLRKFVRQGTLRVRDPDGEVHVFGGRLPGPDIAVHLKNRKLYTKLFVNPELYVPEAYMSGDMELEDGTTVHDVLLLFHLNQDALYEHGAQKVLRRLFFVLRRWHQANSLGRAAANASHHYDLSTELYRLFLDEQMQYTCAYYRDPEHDTLEEAQRNKLIHIASKLRLEPGMTVAELGCGWGGLAIHLARETGVRVTAVNVSSEQVRMAREYARQAGVSDRVAFHEMDYRRLTGTFDRVVSIGLMEHVGVGHYGEFFRQVRELTAPGGFALVHSIGRTSPSVTSPFTRKYIFPGGYVPALSEVFPAIERSGLWCCDMEVLRLHYYYTLNHWRQRFTANRARAAEIYDERFCRMWEFYLSAAQLGFMHGPLMVFHLLLSTERDAVPITRDFMLDAERAALAEMPDDIRGPRKSRERITAS
jgi:cyclopropane-fatty-acyl-phospholipid synthase